MAWPPVNHQDAQDEIAKKANRQLAVRSVTSGPYTLVAADAVDMIVEVNSATTVFIHPPTDAAQSIPQQVSIPWRQIGVGQITFGNNSGTITMNSRGGAYKSAGQFAEGVLTKTGANTWVVSGDLIA